MCSHASVLVESLMTSSAPLPRQVLNWHYLPKASVGSLLLCLSYSPLQSESEVTQSCLTFCNHIDCSPLGSCVQGILQTRILEWVVMPSSRGSSQTRDQIQVFHIAGRFFTIWATRIIRSFIISVEVTWKHHWNWSWKPGFETYLPLMAWEPCWRQGLMWASVSWPEKWEWLTCHSESC